MPTGGPRLVKRINLISSGCELIKDKPRLNVVSSDVNITASRAELQGRAPLFFQRNAAPQDVRPATSAPTRLRIQPLQKGVGLSLSLGAQALTVRATGEPGWMATARGRSEAQLLPFQQGLHTTEGCCGSDALTAQLAPPCVLRKVRSLGKPLKRGVAVSASALPPDVCVKHDACSHQHRQPSTSGAKQPPAASGASLNFMPR
jgi:hypothetical protein